MYDNLMMLLQIIGVTFLLDFIAMTVIVICKFDVGAAGKETGVALLLAHTGITIFVTWGVVG